MSDPERAHQPHQADYGIGVRGIMSGKSVLALKWLSILAFVSLTVVCLIGFAAAYMSRQPGCPYLRVWFRDQCEYSRAFTGDALLVDESSFQTDVTIVRVAPLAYHGAAERFAVDIHLDDDASGGHEISRWSSSARAAEAYAETTADQFRDVVFPCCTVDSFSYTSPLADQFIVRCSTAGYCKAVARYQDYVSIVTMSTTDRFAASDFADLLARIDQRIGKYLS